MDYKSVRNPAQEFLSGLASFPADSFESRFCHQSASLNLAAKFDRNELTLLYEAGLGADLCQLAFNGREPNGQNILRSDEGRRCRLEWEFLNARDIFYASPGWQNLPVEDQQLIERAFLSVAVAENNQAW